MLTTDVRLHSASAAGATAHPAAPIQLAATMYLPDTPATGLLPGLVVAHGAGSRRTHHADFCQAAAAEGFLVLAVDLRGHGDSEGAADGPLEDDLTVAADFLRRHRLVDPARLCYRGSSMGGFYGLKAAAAGTFAAVALLCPASEHLMLTGLEAIVAYNTDTEEAGTRAESATHWDVPATRRYFAHQDSLATAARVKCPVLLIHARGDETVPLSHTLALAARLPGDTTVVAMKGGTHSSAQHDPKVHHLTARWLLDHT